MRRVRALEIINLKKYILDFIENDQSATTRITARKVGFSHWTVWRTLKENWLYPKQIKKSDKFFAANYV